MSEKTYLNQENIIEKYQFFYFTPPPQQLAVVHNSQSFRGNLSKMQKIIEKNAQCQYITFRILGD